VTKRTQRAQSEHFERILINVFKCYYIVNDVKIDVVENKSYGVKNHLHSCSDVRHCMSYVTSGTVMINLLIINPLKQSVFLMLILWVLVYVNMRDVKKIR
jgi:hypothetical protein